MDKLEENPISGHHQGAQFFEQIKNMMTNLVSAEQPSSSVSTAVNLPVQLTEAVSIPHIKATFMAFADAMIPSTLGALDLRLDEYIVWTLEHYVSIQGDWSVKTVPLAAQTAQILDIAAFQLIVSGKVKVPPDFSTYPDGGPFAALSPVDRFEAISLLDNIQVDLEVLPYPFRNNAGLVKNVVSSLHQMVMFGYYSEWFSFGSTRLAYPENYRLERHRFIWERLNYPGPSFGYRALRGFLVDKFSE
ncbi:hypothetical protein PB1_13144 [Bacillus methanolicus PB1]|uniref:Uncharacterized protein n=1 Tax=Bacillus methanolicus PB1 TaxID=997296 RepID=I3DW84_BACMT|nr:hypothetical protein [Bacillus methanolicus]EIJ78505.1 hypothetical protein PB1_13144 [Bacillus methanolicus PB1]